MSIFARLFLLIGLVSGVSLSVVAGLLWRNSVGLEQQLRAENNEAGAKVRREGTRLLEDDLRQTHVVIVREKARRVESYFENIAQSVQLQSALARQFLLDGTSPSGAPPLFPANTLTGLARRDPRVRRNLVGVRPYAIFHLAPGTLEKEARSKMSRLRRLGAYFAHAQKSIPGCDSAYFGSEQGFILGYPGGASYFKNAYDPRKRPWYRDATAPTLRGGAMAWIVYPDRASNTLMLTCARAVSMDAGKPDARSGTKPVGVAAVDVQLKAVLDEMFDLGRAPDSRLSVSQAILVDGSGKVRISKSYLNSRPLSRSDISTPPVESLPGFAQAYRQARARPRQSAGLYWDGQQDKREMGRAHSVYIYARVRFSGEENSMKSNPSEAWHYIVQLPLPSLLEPIQNVSRQMDASTSQISLSIQARTRESAAIVLALIGATLLAALSVAFFAARATSRPLIQMAHVTRGVGQGNLDQQAVETGGGEIGELGRAINTMIAGLRQRDLLRENFGRYVAPSVVDDIVRQGGAQVGGAASTTTVFFSDLVGFTSLAEATSPQVLVGLLNEYFSAMTQVILDEEGTLDKYIGDAVLAFWGEPIAHEDDAARACRAALRQREQLQVLGARWEEEGRPKLEMRIGIATGEVIVGNVGSNLKLNYTVLGDTVNFASRLEGANKFYSTRILIGDETRRLAGDSIHAREVDLLAVVGKSVPERVYELLGMAGEVAPTRLEGCALYERALSAYRARQWDEAQSLLDQAQQVLGSDGPSRILSQRIERLRHEPPPPDWDGSSALEHK